MQRQALAKFREGSVQSVRPDETHADLLLSPQADPINRHAILEARTTGACA